MTTDEQGRYQFAGLPAGRYHVVFSGLPPNRAFTARSVGSDPDRDSDADPKTGASRSFTLGPGAANLVPAGDLDVAAADFVDPTLSAGLVGVYSLGDTVWQDGNGNGVLDPGDIGVPEVAVQLLTPAGQVLRRTVTSGTGRFTFDGLPAGTYQVQFGRPPDGLRFTSERAGANPAVDSDADLNGRTQLVQLGDENPTDTTVDAGLTTPANYSTAPVPAAASATPVDTELSSTGGAPPQLIDRRVLPGRHRDALPGGRRTPEPAVAQPSRLSSAAAALTWAQLTLRSRRRTRWASASLSIAQRRS